MARQAILRLFLFILFFSIGAASLSTAILCGELRRYYTNKQLLGLSEESLRKLEALNADYDVLLSQMKKDPNLIGRIAPVTLGTEPKGEDTVYPKTTAEQLAAAKETLAGDSKREMAEPEVPKWIVRCNRPYQRVILFLASAGLILVSFICFGSVVQKE